MAPKGPIKFKNMENQKNWFLRHKILSALLIIIALIIIGSLFSNGDSGKKNVSNKTIEQPDVKKTEETSAPREWNSVFKVSATANKQTEGFILSGGQQKIIYKNTGSPSSCFIYVMKEGKSLDVDGGIPEVMIDGDKSDETMMRKDRGSYYLDIKVVNSICDVEIQELK